MFTEFEREVNAGAISAFEEIDTKLTLAMLQARKEYITNHFADQDFTMQCLDPEFKIQPIPFLDILFFTPPTALDKLPTFGLAQGQAKSTGVLIGYHYVKEVTEPDMYQNTNVAPPEANKLMFAGRSASLGRIEAADKMFLTAICSSAEQASGGCLLDDNLNVVGILMGSYYDKGSPQQQVASLEAALTLAIDPRVPEDASASNDLSRNRNLFLSITHPAVQSLFSKL